MQPNPNLPVAGEASLSVEQSLLGTLITFPDRIESIRDTMLASDFVEPLHGEIFNAICQLHDVGDTPTVSSIAARVPYYDGIPEGSVRAYLAKVVAHDASPAASIGGNSKAVRDAAGMRMLQDLVIEAQSALSTGAIVDPVPLANQVIAKADAVVATGMVSGAKPQSLATASRSALERAVKAKYSKEPPGIPTNLPELNKMLGGGLKGGNLYILAGRPAMGKTATALTIALTASRRGKPTCGYSLEMSAEDLAERALSAQTELMDRGIEYRNISAGAFDDEEEKILYMAQRELEGMPFWIDPRPKLTIGQICASARRYVAKEREKNPEAEILLWVDYLSLVTSGERYKGNRVKEVGEVTSTLKALAKELDVPVLLLAQLSRGVEHRDDKRPILADLRESGEIEQDADVVMFVYREEYYLKQMSVETLDKAEAADYWKRLTDSRGKMEIIVAKQRKGQTGKVTAAVNLGCNTIHELAGRAA